MALEFNLAGSASNIRTMTITNGPGAPGDAIGCCASLAPVLVVALAA